MTTIVPQWTLETLQDAKAKHQFILVTPTGHFRVYIIDAHNLWTTNPNIFFQTGYRIAGTQEDITNALLNQGIDADTIRYILDTSITSLNYNGEFAPIYNEELADYNTWRRGVVKSNQDEPGVKLFDIIAAVNPGILEQIKTVKQAKAIGLTTGLPVKTRGRGIKSLYDKIQALAPGKVLDVSRLDATGAGARASDPPTQRSKKYGSPNLPIVSFDLDHYLLAIRMLPGGEQQYAADVQYVRELFNRLRATPTTGAILTIPGVTLPIVQGIPTTAPLIPTAPGFPTTSLIPTNVPGLIATTPVRAQPITTPPPGYVEPEKVYPLYTKAQRNRRRKAEERAALAAQGLTPIQGGILQAPFATIHPQITVPPPPTFPYTGIQTNIGAPQFFNPLEYVEEEELEDEIEDEIEEGEWDEEEEEEFVGETIAPPRATPRATIPTTPRAIVPIIQVAPITIT